MEIQIDPGTLTVTQHITLEVKNYNSSCVYFCLEEFSNISLDGEMKPWGQTELEKKRIILFG